MGVLSHKGCVLKKKLKFTVSSKSFYLNLYIYFGST